MPVKRESTMEALLISQVMITTATVGSRKAMVHVITIVEAGVNKGRRVSNCVYPHTNTVCKVM